MQTPQDLRKNDFYGQTVVHPVGLTALICLSIAILFLPRKYAVWPLIFMGCFVSPAQRLMLGSLNFPFLRILLVFAVARILSRGELARIRFRVIDWLVLIFLFTKTLVFTIQNQDFGAFILQSGASFDAITLYVAFRSLIRNWEDLNAAILGFIFASIPVTVAFVIENATGRNLFAFLGGVAEITEVRDGRVRCQGAFSHAILAGCYWASVIPLIAARWFDPKMNRAVTLVGIGSSIMNVILCASSTPIMAMVFAAVGAMFFPLRRQMHYVRWAIPAVLTVLHFSMEAPVWHLISRINVMGSSTGWHRYFLMDQAINRFGEWWLFGTKDTEHWGHGLWDVTNQFILEGVRGGFATMMLFIAIIAHTFRNVGALIRLSTVRCHKPQLYLSWGLGVMMFVHVTSFFAVSYFGQIAMLFWLTVGAAAGICDGEGALRNGPRSSNLRSTGSNSSNVRINGIGSILNKY